MTSNQNEDCRQAQANSAETSLPFLYDRQATTDASDPPICGHEHQATITQLLWSADIPLITIVHCIAGLNSIVDLSVAFFMKDGISLSPTQAAILSSSAQLPLLLTPVYGLISDTFPLGGYKRKSYLMLASVLGSLSMWSMATIVNSFATMMCALLVACFAGALGAVVMDALVVERARGHPQEFKGVLQSLVWGAVIIGKIIASYSGGAMLQNYGARNVFCMTAFIPLLSLVFICFIHEKRMTGNHTSSFDTEFATPHSSSYKEGPLKQGSTMEHIRYHMSLVRSALLQRRILMPTLFIMLWTATPTTETAWFYYATNQLKFSPEFLGKFALAGTVASLVGILLYSVFLKNVKIRKLVLCCILVGSSLSMLPLLLISGVSRSMGMSDKFFAVGDTVIFSVVTQISFMPVLVMAATVCPPGIEATFNAVLTSLVNFAAVVSGLLGGCLTMAFGVTQANFNNMFWLVLVCAVLGLLPVLCIRMMPETLEELEEGAPQKRAGESESEVALTQGVGYSKVAEKEESGVSTNVGEYGEERVHDSGRVGNKEGDLELGLLIKGSDSAACE